jgi:hypothetical protein
MYFAMENTVFSDKNSLFKSTIFSSVCTSMSMGSTKRLLDELMAPDKPYPETDSKVGLLESGRRPAKWPFIQWLYALTTISGELAPTSRLPKYRFLLRNCRAKLGVLNEFVS